MDATIATAAACAAACAAWGAAGMPRAIDALLKHKARAMSSYWEEMRAALGEKMEDGKIAEGTDEELVKWAMRQRAQVGGRKLTLEQTAALKEMGIVSETVELEGLPTEAEAAAEYAFESNAASRALCALACAALPLLACIMCHLGLMSGALALPIAAVILASAAWAVMCAILACDLAAKLIPWQLCLLLAALGVGFALCGPTDGGGSATNLLAGAALGLGAYIACKGVNGVARFLTGAGAIGQGDLRIMPVLCLLGGLKGSMVGFAAATALMLAIAVVALIRGAGRRDYIPYAPGLTAWTLAGMLTQLSTMGGSAL